MSRRSHQAWCTRRLRWCGRRGTDGLGRRGGSEVRHWKQAVRAGLAAGLMSMVVLSTVVLADGVQNSGYGQGPGATEVAPSGIKGAVAPIEVKALPNTGGGPADTTDWIELGALGGGIGLVWLV